eukprot:14573235-Heterocapsa_arctica.AAC.1
MEGLDKMNKEIKEDFDVLKHGRSGEMELQVALRAPGFEPKQETAEEYRGQKITDAVVTGPACCNDFQC